MNAQIWLLKMRVSAVSALKVFANFYYVLLAILGAIIASFAILWALNLGLVGYIIFDAPLSLIQKFEFFYFVYRDLYTTYTSIQSTGIVVFSVLFGVNLALLVYVLKNQGFASIPKKSSISSFVLAIVGGGCLACGTSIIAPLIITLGAVSSPFVRSFGALLNWIASLLMIYSIYKLGVVCSFILAKSLTKSPSLQVK